MQRIWADRGSEAWALRTERPFAGCFDGFPFRGEPFALLLNVLDPGVTPDEQSELSELLVELGCRYAVCAGHRCSTWDDSIDEAVLEKHDFDVPAAAFVMTTWHEAEPISDVAWYFANQTTFYDDAEPTRFLLVQVGGDEASLRAAQAAVSAQLGAARGA